MGIFSPLHTHLTNPHIVAVIKPHYWRLGTYSPEVERARPAVVAAGTQELFDEPVMLFCGSSKSAAFFLADRVILVQAGLVGSRTRELRYDRVQVVRTKQGALTGEVVAEYAGGEVRIRMPASKVQEAARLLRSKAG
ncbi:PH domain-containing protein [Falsarthrobacter nasiphocae]|uniref:Metalloprotease with PDZ domain n=1 Tax=Falsarthrobacter nasiphocae TaxID=189863 RepID=A0AAE4C5U5_9MICC|nr:PH domain-containing protein [Falsarthrobacter nasiphocae]MDR6891442.1 putative metalloprotease with PDZ domain [Falsarthrobacter nasiphocae]